MPQKRISIFSSIAILFSVLFSVIVISLISYSFLRSEFALEKIAKRLNLAIVEQIKQEFTLLVEPVNSYFDITEAVITQSKKSDLNNKSLHDILLTFLLKNSQLYNTFVSLPDGTFLMASKSPVNKITYIDRNKNFTVTTLYDDKGQRISQNRVAKISYNPKQRSWFKGALLSDSVYTSDVYTFFSSQQSGVTFSKAIYDQEGDVVAILGVDLLLTNVQEFLDNIDISSQSFIAIIDKYKGHHILSNYPDNDEKKHFEMLKKFYRFSQNKTFNQIEFFGKNYYFTESDIGSGFFSNWKYMIAVPETELINEILIMRKQSVWFGVVVLILGCGIIFLFSKLFSKPITAISIRANNITQLKKESLLAIKSPVAEIHELIHSINSLGTAFDSFMHYVPKTIVRHLIQTKQSATISGQRYDITLLFTDIEQFTDYCDQESPENVSMYLSQYFDLISKKVTEYGGTIDKYIGDSLMVFWGAPVKHEDHAQRSINCVLEIKKILESAEIKSHPILSKFKTRFAIHTGKAVIGNIGSSERINYTAIGRDVNICARLESLNKQFNTYFLISDQTKQIINKDIRTRPLEPVNLKGVKRKVMVHELLGDSIKDDYIKEFTIYQKLYIKKDYKSAKAGFLKLLKINKNDSVVQYFLKKIKVSSA